MSGLFLAALFACASGVLAEDNSAAMEQATGLAKTLEAALNSKDVAKGDATFDVDVLLDRVMVGVTTSPEFSSGFRTGAKKDSLLGRMIQAGASTTTYHFLRVRQVNGDVRALFRMTKGNGGVNYSEWVLGKDAQGQPKFVDLYAARPLPANS